MLQQGSVSSGCAVLAEVGFFLAVARVRVVRWNRGVDGCQFVLFVARSCELILNLTWITPTVVFSRFNF